MIAPVRLDDRNAPIYLEHGRLHVENAAVRFTSPDSETTIPVAVTSALLLGPGTTVTAEAVRVATANGCTLTWTNSHRRVVYASAPAELTVDTLLTNQQARLAALPALRLAAARRMLTVRFGEAPPTHRSSAQLRGWEGARQRALYSELSRKYHIPWRRRTTDIPWAELDAPNRALSEGNTILYTAVHTACGAFRLNPDIGILHSGRPRAFIMDIADVYKRRIVTEPVFAALQTSTDSLAAVQAAVPALWHTLHDDLTHILG